MQMRCIVIQIPTYPMLPMHTYFKLVHCTITFCADALMWIIIIIILVVYMTFNLDDVFIYSLFYDYYIIFIFIIKHN